MAKDEKKESKKSKESKEMQTKGAGRALSPYEEMDRMFDRMLQGFFPRGWMRPFRTDWPAWGELAAPLELGMPKVDVIDRDNEVVVRADIPGVRRENLDVSVSENMVTIKGETKHEEKEEKGNYYRRETSRGTFSRTIALPSYVSSDECKATFKDGVLELTLPKLEKAKRRTIKID